MEETNETLAERYQAGDLSAAARLWEQNFPLACSLAWKYYLQHEKQCAAAGLTSEDLQQESFFVILGAARAYKPERGIKLASYFSLQAKARFNEVTGLHGTTPVLNTARNIEEPIPGTDRLTIADVVDDPAAVADFDDADERMRNEKLRAALLDALGRCSKSQREGIEYCYFKAQTMHEAAAALGTTYAAVRTRVQSGINRIRHSPVVMKRLQGFVEYGAAYNATGWAGWKKSGSVEERLVENALRVYDESKQRRAYANDPRNGVGGVGYPEK